MHTGNCAAEAKKLCEDEKPGEGRLAKCISNEIAAAEANTEGRILPLLHTISQCATALTF
jgi:hypothetical protein